MAMVWKVMPGNISNASIRLQTKATKRPTMNLAIATDTAWGQSKMDLLLLSGIKKQHQFLLKEFGILQIVISMP